MGAEPPAAAGPATNLIENPLAAHPVIHAAWRVVSTAAGLGALAAGGYAVFASHLEAGPVALLAVGFLFLVIAMSGRLPTRIRLGDNEASWQEEREAAQDFVEQVVVQTGDETRLHAVSALEALNRTAPRLAAPALRAILYEEQVMTMLRQIQLTAGTDTSGMPAFTLLIPRDAQGHALANALLVIQGGTAVAAEVGTLSRPMDGQAAGTVRARLSRLRHADPSVRGCLLITRAGVTRTALNIIGLTLPVRQIQITGPEAIDSLADAIRECLAEAQAQTALA